MAFDIASLVYNQKFLTYIGSTIVILTLILMIIIFIEMRIKRTVQIKLNEKGISYLRRISKLKKMRKRPSQELKELNTVIKEFLKDYFKVNYTPTYGEALEMIEEKKNTEDIKQLCTQASAYIYAGEHPDEEGIDKLIQLFEDIIKYRLIKLDEQKAREIEKIVESTKEQIIDERKIRMVMATLVQGRRELKNSKIEEAEKSYSIANSIYQNMNEKERKICKDRLVAFYQDIEKKKPKEEKKTTVTRSPELSALVSSSPTTKTDEQKSITQNPQQNQQNTTQQPKNQ